MLRERNIIYRKWFTLFICCFLLGVLLVNLAGQRLLTEEGIFGTADVSRLKYMEVEQNSFFQYVMGSRIRDYLLLGLLSTTCLGIAAAYAAVALWGMLTGMVITAAVIRFGLKGLLLILGGFFPHQLLFVPAGVMMLDWCYQNCCFLYYPHKCLQPPSRSRKNRYIRQGAMLLWILTVLLLGCVLESYVNPMLVSDLMQLF